MLDRLVWGPPYGEVTAEPGAARCGGCATAGCCCRRRPARSSCRARWPCICGRAARTGRPSRCRRARRGRRADAPSTGCGQRRRPGQAYTALATVEELLKDWDEGGPAVLRAGGLSVRDLKRTAVALDVTEPVAAFWVELAYAAGLLASDGEADERYAPTPAYDEWLELPAAERWARLATAWLTATRTPGLVGGQDTKGRTLSALGPDLDRSAAPEVRRRVLDLLAALPAGTAPDPGVRAGPAALGAPARAAHGATRTQRGPQSAGPRRPALPARPRGR